jgi:hypothetical protein
VIRDINIKAVLNGYVVQVGCQTVVFSTRTDLILALNSYLENPEQTEKQYQALPNARHTLLDAVATQACERAYPATATDLYHGGGACGESTRGPR